MLYFKDDPWVHDDSIFSVHDQIILDPQVEDANQPDADRRLTASFDFKLKPANEKTASGG